ncbi:T-cell ecto-ADP-ribosyltransferase 2 [Austrofundulus limnaeus]|uniref:NAD(P)(+)--arginine ADP-ribosyltransferase n=1 Tax=Austrofundulus limnaeus TaxID=52670 RepID=A0A2I4BWK4_AUSLI|nr:PREDICTED: T-cell ecto-ADP-ribosyltransferase 2-like [Austrofundulus limnaeus]
MEFRFQSVRLLRDWVVLCAFLLVVLLFLRHWWLQRPAEAEEPKTLLPLDMATDSVDDMYAGCRSESVSMIELFGVFEWHANKPFSIAWSLVEKAAKKPVHKHLRDDHSTAVYLFTSYGPIRQNFSRALKTGKHEYSTNKFTFHYFYFYLTETIQVLNNNQTPCRTVYHRTWQYFDRNVMNAFVRFGALTWAVSSKQSFELDGNVSCFEIYTCFGADITHYSSRDQEGQVLIPTYEVFKVTRVLTDESWCNMVYNLQSTKIPKTDQNCKLFQSLRTFFDPSMKHVDGGNVVAVSACLLLIIMISLILIKHNQKCYVAVVLGWLLVIITVALLLG